MTFAIPIYVDFLSLSLSNWLYAYICATIQSQNYYSQFETVRLVIQQPKSRFYRPQKNAIIRHETIFK